MTPVAVILAAGLGTRLADVTRGSSKALLSIDGASLLARLLAASARAGVEEAIVVTGHEAEAVDRALQSAPLPCRSVHNPAFATAGNARSLWSAREAIAGRSFLKLDGDLLLADAIVAELAGQSESVLSVDRRAELDAEAMKIRSEGGWVTAIGKQIAGADGESIGLERIDARDVEALMAELAQTDGYYEDAYAALVTRGLRLAVHEVHHAWIEIDDADDLARAERMRW
jgi:1L-myo-inositol 1-phosphate cytidylyltransferase